MLQQQNRTAVYCRLSHDDGDGESMSIGNQREMLVRYCKDNGLPVVDIYIDDGFSGTNFERPAFQRMIQDVEDGKIDVVLVKDQSRLGREHLKTGYYIEIFFAEHNVRFIAVNDNVDTDKGDNDFMGFRNMINELYAKDISKKIRSSRKNLALKGAYTSPYAPYGYRKNPNNKHKLIPDENTAPVVKRMFQMALDGMNPYQIANVLEKEEVLTPRMYINKTCGGFENFVDKENPYAWFPITVANILRNRLYVGDSVGQKGSTKSFKSKKRILVPEEDWIIVKNTHEALVDRETFEIVSKMVKIKKRPTSKGERQIFHGLVKCADCGCGLSFSTVNNNGNYTCCNYRNKGRRHCTAHFISYKSLYRVVEENLRKQMKPLQDSTAEFIEGITQNREKVLKQQSSKLLREQRQLKQRLDELQRICRKLYEDNALGKLTNEEYYQYSADYKKEQADVSQRLEELTALLSKQKTELENITKFAEVAKKYLDFTELTKPMLNELIDKIVVHEGDKSTGKRTQKIDIYYRFIGLID